MTYRWRTAAVDSVPYCPVTEDVCGVPDRLLLPIPAGQSVTTEGLSSRKPGITKLLLHYLCA